MTYKQLMDLVKKGSAEVRYTYRNGDIEYWTDEGGSCLTRGDKVICIGYNIWSFDNKDYVYKSLDGESHVILKRGDKVLYKGSTECGIQEDFSFNNYTYHLIDVETDKLIRELVFPFEESILDIIDAKIKEEPYVE